MTPDIFLIPNEMHLDDDSSDYLINLLRLNYLQLLLSASKKSSFSSWLMLVCLPKLRTFAKKTRTSVVTSIVSFFLLVSFSLGNAVSARASPEGVASYSTSSTKVIPKMNEGDSTKMDVNDKKFSRTVDVEFIVASHAGVDDKASKATGKTAAKVVRKAYKRNKNNPKSLSNDLYELGGEAEHEVKQSWESLTGSMKGEREGE